ncbi:MAG: late competence development ComFB family protein [Thiomicrospira sp.]|jgi:hypothetical protein|nr:late competence development ComFB family protein [Thiomicrospira sp.]
MEFDSVHNYYERLVFDEIGEHYRNSELNEEQLADMACIALNQIQPRYIRHDVDMSFFMSSAEYIMARDMVHKAVKNAYKKIRKYDRSEHGN